MSPYGRYGGETKVHVGNLGTGAGKGELERAFSYYGPLRTVCIARNPPEFAFVECEDPRDAEDAVSANEEEASQDLDRIPDPGEGDTLVHAAGAVEGGQDQHLLNDQASLRRFRSGSIIGSRYFQSRSRLRSRSRSISQPRSS